jgi:membrane-associated phospholipid phosphatase
MDGVYLSWMISALALGVILLPLFKPPWFVITIPSFVDFVRRYWIHILIVFMIYNAKDFLDQIDRILMASAGLDMTPWIYAIEGNMVLWVQQSFENDWLTTFLTHYYVTGFMFICYVSIFYFAYFDDRWLADRITLSIAWVYILAIPFYLFFNVRVTGDTIPEMETLAYNLTPEIQDWFRRIDPFSNAMPSLHIGVPFAVWLCITRFDEDRRWNRYRHLVLSYVLLTAFAIVYLGIHWFLDIIGGMLVAAAAVGLADKTAGRWWSVFDERTINARLVTVLTNPGKAWSIINSKIKEIIKQYKRPTSKETGALVVVVLILITSIITWDLTHQSLPAGGVEAPQGVEAVDGWMVTMDNRTEGALLVVHDLSILSPDSIDIVQPIMELDSPYALSESLLVMANNTTLMAININSPQVVLLNLAVDSPDLVLIAKASSGPAIIILKDGEITGVNLEGQQIVMPTPEIDNIILVKTSGSEIAYVTSDNPTIVYIARIGTAGAIQIEIDAQASPDQDLVLETWGTPVNMADAEINNLVFNYDYVAATVNVTATDRLVLFDRDSGEQWLASDAKYSVRDPSIGHGILAWSVKDHLNPTNPQEKYLDGEIYFMNLERNITETLTSDELEQWGPHVLENHLVYFEMDDEGIVTIEIHSWQPELKLYSNIIMQFGTLAAIILVFIHAFQRQLEAKIIKNE